MPSSPPVYRANAIRTRKCPTWLNARLMSANAAPVVRTTTGPSSAPTAAAAAIANRRERNGFGETCSANSVAP